MNKLQFGHDHSIIFEYPSYILAKWNILFSNFSAFMFTIAIVIYI